MYTSYVATTLSSCVWVTLSRMARFPSTRKSASTRNYHPVSKVGVAT